MKSTKQMKSTMMASALVLAMSVAGMAQARVVALVCTKATDRTYNCTVATSTAFEPIVIRTGTNGYMYNGDHHTIRHATTQGVRYDFTVYARNPSLGVSVCAGNQDPWYTTQRICTIAMP